MKSCAGRGVWEKFKNQIFDMNLGSQEQAVPTITEVKRIMMLIRKRINASVSSTRKLSSRKIRKKKYLKCSSKLNILNAKRLDTERRSPLAIVLQGKKYEKQDRATILQDLWTF